MFAKKDPATGDDNTGEKSPRFFDRALKWVTALTAIISLFFAVQKVTQTVADNTARTQQIAELLRVATMQQQAMDYSRAWDSLATASQMAAAGDAFAQLLYPRTAENAKIQTQREDLAMAWLMNAQAMNGKGFSDIVDKLVPVLERGTGSAAPQRKADLLAHIGWSYFLRSRDGYNNFDPSQQYAQAIALDPENPFANAYWGHWILWQGGDIDAANAHFAEAMHSNREHDGVRYMQLVAFSNAGARGEPGYIKTVMEMMNSGETISDTTRSIARRVLEGACSKYGESDLARLKAQIPIADLVSMYKQLSAQTTPEEMPQRNECLARLK